MKPIKLVKSNAEKINIILNEVNGRAADHTYYNYKDVEIDAAIVIGKVEKLLGGKKHNAGVVIAIESGDPVPSAYKYTRIATRVVLECRSSGWFITYIGRVDIWKKGGESTIHFTQAHHERATEVLRGEYVVVEL